MNLHSSVTPNFRLGLDNTTISTFVTCPRKYQLSMLANLRPARPSVIFDFGIAYHHILETWDKWQLTEDNPFTVSDLIKYAHTYVHQSHPKLVTSDDTKRNIFTLIRSVVWYIDYYSDSNLQPLRLADGTPALELSFSFQLPFPSPTGEPILYCGHIDGVFSNQNNRPIVLDRKTTTSALGDHFFARYSNSSQMIGYAIGAHLTFDIAVQGVIIDACSLGVNFTRFSRQQVNITPARAEEYLADLEYWINQLHEFTVKNYFPMNRASCHNYGGCEFLPLCSKCPSVRDKFIEGNYVVGDQWNPLEAR